MQQRTRIDPLRRLLLCLMLFQALPLAVCWAGPSHEYQLKAGFLVNFIRFISWPQQAFPEGQPELILCVAGNDPFGSALDELSQRTIGERPLRVLTVPSLEQVPRCHLLYVGRSEQRALDLLAALTASQAVVTVSDIRDFARAGGGIEFVVQNDRLSFIINNTVLKQQGIQARAALLDLAAAVY
ncbi:YfiR family protein [Desulfogranum mediterraneum]|uniref:YfiR family protein n=1 Tax=Desulfogranum mediterraneum TaxID=160661 RepID=UPI00048D57FB|nr:YfiR family protein [Desulfogranum mediterraneum]